MFRRKTLFILGAGSSHEVGLPIGSTLKTDIARALDLSKESARYSKIMLAIHKIAGERDMGYGNINPYLEKANVIKNALPLAISIDNLLDAHKGDLFAETCGKLGIIASILGAERKSQLFNKKAEKSQLLPEVSNSWFSSFIKILTENVAKNEIENIFSNVTFINFNYDRCLEHYIYHAIRTYYNISSNEAKALVGKLKIYRPYGSVGKLEWQEANLPSVPFGDSDYDLPSLLTGIKTFNEQINDINELSLIRSLVESAQNIVFLGFAFHPQNIKLLKTESGISLKSIYGTAYGLSDSDCINITENLRNTIHFNLHTTKINLEQSLKCSNLLDQYGRTLSS